MQGIQEGAKYGRTRCLALVLRARSAPRFFDRDLRISLFLCKPLLCLELAKCWKQNQQTYNELLGYPQP